MRLGNPSFTLFLTLFLSFFMWLFPDFSILRSGFRQKAELLSIEGIILIIIYIFFILIVNLASSINIVRSELRIYFCLSVHAVGNDYGHMFASNITDRFCLPAFRRQIVEFWRLQSRNIGMILPQQNIIHQFTGYRNFSFGCFTQRYADGIAQPVAQQCSDAESRLDTPVLSVSGFCHSEV